MGTRAAFKLVSLLAIVGLVGLAALGAQKVGKEWGRLVLLNEYTYAGER